VKQIKGFLILTGAAVLVACATEAPTPATGSAVNGNAAVAGNTIAASSAPGSSAPMRVPYGYTRVVTSDGTEVFCRYDLDTSSRVARTKVCLTAAQLAVDQQNSQDFIRNVQQHGAGINDPTTPGAGGAAY